MEDIISKHEELVRNFNAIAAKLGIAPYTGRFDAAGDDLIVTEDGLVRLPGDQVSTQRKEGNYIL